MCCQTAISLAERSSPVIDVLVVGVLQLDSVEGRAAAPVNHQALVGDTVGEEEVVSGPMVVTLVGQDPAGIPVGRVGRVAAVDRGRSACKREEGGVWACYYLRYAIAAKLTGNRARRSLLLKVDVLHP